MKTNKTFSRHDDRTWPRMTSEVTFLENFGHEFGCVTEFLKFDWIWPRLTSIDLFDLISNFLLHVMWRTWHSAIILLFLAIVAIRPHLTPNDPWDHWPSNQILTIYLGQKNENEFLKIGLLSDFKKIKRV